MKNFSLLLTLLLLIAACGEKGKDNVTLNGHIEGLGEDTLYLFGTDLYYDRIDTLPVKNGKFAANLQVDTLISTRLLFHDGTTYPLYLDRGNHISIKGSSDGLRSLDISGNRPNQELTAFRKELKEVKDPAQEAEKAEAFIRSHPLSLVSLDLLDHYFVQTPQPDIKRIRDLIKGLSGELKDRPYLNRLEEQLSQTEKGQVGKNFPYFRLPNKHGDKKSRHDFKDQYLLIHFWASWDTVSRRQQEVYRRLYQKERKNKQLALIGISLDIEPDRWRNSLRQDSLTWEQLCDFNGWENSLVKQLGVQAIPCNFLVSPAGTITAVNLDEPAMEKEIRELKDPEKQKKTEDLKKRVSNTRLKTNL